MCKRDKTLNPESLCAIMKKSELSLSATTVKVGLSKICTRPNYKREAGRRSLSKGKYSLKSSSLWVTTIYGRYFRFFFTNHSHIPAFKVILHMLNKMVRAFPSRFFYILVNVSSLNLRLIFQPKKDNQASFQV